MHLLLFGTEKNLYQFVEKGGGVEEEVHDSNKA